MKVYFVRHGQSEANLERKVQGETGHLSEEGRKQALCLKERLEKIPIEKIISSTHERARETALIINDGRNLPLEESELFVEQKLPSSLIGMDHETALPEMKILWERSHENGYRHSDEETFALFKERGQKALTYLKSHKEEDLLVVSHAYIIKLLLGLMILGDGINSRQLERIQITMLMSNTGISVCEFRKDEEEGKNQGWRIESYNDVTHLG